MKAVDRRYYKAGGRRRRRLFSMWQIIRVLKQWLVVELSPGLRKDGLFNPKCWSRVSFERRALKS